MANTKADADAPLRLTEPASYETGDPNDNYFTAYHSSGVVMFEDSWPTSLYGNKVEGNPGRGKYDTDFNDLILDYDVEAFTVPDMEKYATQGWREQVKVVLHVRATSAHIGANGCTTEIEKAGLILEGFNMANVESIEAFASMDSWQNPHAPQVEENGVLYDFGLPAWAKRDLAANSQYGVIENRGAFVEIGGIPSLKDKNSSAGSEVYERRNDNASIENHVFNPGLKQYSEWKNPKTEQYDSELAKLYDDYGYATLANTQKTGYYNVVPGYVNVNGGLYTFTVIYHMKDRSEMTEQESEAQLANMIDAVYNTFKQNFYVVTTEGYPSMMRCSLPIAPSLMPMLPIRAPMRKVTSGPSSARRSRSICGISFRSLPLIRPIRTGLRRMAPKTQIGTRKTISTADSWSAGGNRSFAI